MVMTDFISLKKSLRKTGNSVLLTNIIWSSNLEKSIKVGTNNGIRLCKKPFVPNHKETWHEKT